MEILGGFLHLFLKELKTIKISLKQRLKTVKIDLGLNSIYKAKTIVRQTVRLSSCFAEWSYELRA